MADWSALCANLVEECQKLKTFTRRKKYTDGCLTATKLVIMDGHTNVEISALVQLVRQKLLLLLRFSNNYPLITFEPYTASVLTPDKDFYSPEESYHWLQGQLSLLKINTLQNLSDKTGIDKGTLSRYFRHERRPSIDSIGPLCLALEISPETLLKVLGAIAK